MIDDFITEDAVLAEVAAQVAAFGREAIATWMLLADDGSNTREGVQGIAHGDALADRALQARASAAD